MLTGVAAPSDHSVWIDVFTAFLMTCGAVMSLFLVIHLWKGLFRMRRETGPIPPGNLRHGIWTIAMMAVSAALIFGAYAWGRAEWGGPTGAALAIGAFVVAAIAWFSWFHRNRAPGRQAGP